jgi:hypothetical protein
MKFLRRRFEIICLGFYFSLAIAGAVAAHDCSGPDDCGVIPPNVDIATGIAAVGAGGAIGWSIVRGRNGKTAPPCEELRKEVEAGAARIKDLEAKVAAAQADLERATKAAEQNPDFGKDLPPGGPKWIA